MKLKFTQTVFIYVIENSVKKVSPTKNLLFVFSLSTYTENRFLFCLPAKFRERIFIKIIWESFAQLPYYGFYVGNFSFHSRKKVCMHYAFKG